MFHSNLMILIISLNLFVNLAKCSKDNTLIELDKFDKMTSSLFKNSNIKRPNLNKNFGLLVSQKSCCTCANSNCVEKNSFKRPTNLFANKYAVQNINRNLDQSKESSDNDLSVNFIDGKTANENLQRSFKFDMSESIRNLVSRLRPQNSIGPYGPNTDLSQMSYAPFTAYGYRPNYGHLDVTPSRYPEFTPFISNGLGSSLGTPYGTGLGLGSSFGIYDNFYPNSFGTSKSTMLRRKLVPNEGVLLLTEIEDPDLGIPHETLALNSGRNIGLGKRENINYHHNFGTPKFSLQLTSSNEASDLNLDNSDQDLLFYSNQLRLIKNQLNG